MGHCIQWQAGRSKGFSRERGFEFLYGCVSLATQNECPWTCTSNCTGWVKGVEDADAGGTESGTCNHHQILQPLHPILPLTIQFCPLLAPFHPSPSLPLAYLLTWLAVRLCGQDESGLSADTPAVLNFAHCQSTFYSWQWHLYDSQNTIQTLQQRGIAPVLTLNLWHIIAQQRLLHLQSSWCMAWMWFNAWWFLLGFVMKLRQVFHPNDHNPLPCIFPASVIWLYNLLDWLLSHVCTMERFLFLWINLPQSFPNRLSSTRLLAL